MTEDIQQQLWADYLDLVVAHRTERIALKARVIRKAGQKLPKEGSAHALKLSTLCSADPLLTQIREGKAGDNPELCEEFSSLIPLLEDLRREQGDNKTLRQVRQLYQNQVTYDQAIQELKGLDLQALFEKELNPILENDIKEVQRYLQEDDLVLQNGALRTGLNLQNAEPFFAQFEGENLQCFLENVIFSRKLPRHLLHRMLRYVPSVWQAMDLSVPGKPRLATELLQAVEPFCGRYMQSMHAAFPILTVLEIVKKRKRYRKAANQYEKYLSIRNAMIRAIPSHYRDLYPKARLMHRSFILHIGPTNSGKTYDAVTRLEESGNGVYLAPLRLLAYEQFDTINHDGVPCSLLTGEEEISVVCSQITASTIEMADLNRHYAVAVIDEAQMITDPERGGSWSSAILGLLADEIHVCASPDAEQLLVRIVSDCGDSVSVVHHTRQTPLITQMKPFRFPDDVEHGDALVVFSKRSVHGVAAELQKARNGMRTSIIYGALPYDVRHEQARRFREGETEVVVATDAIGMGLNLPIRRIVFLEMTKFDGTSTRDLKATEIKQIAGRAGRYGIYDEGLVAATDALDIIRESIEEADIPLQEAVIQFHETLLGIDAPLTDILRRWNEMEPQNGWIKANIDRMIFLASSMERQHTDKEFLYRMITIPFDGEDSYLLGLWKEMYLLEEDAIHMDVLSRLPEPIDPQNVSERQLDTLEHEYRICDLFANYVRLFLRKEDALRATIDHRKSLLSEGIMKILASRKLRGKTCRRCGRSMPWDYPFSVCSKCMYRERYRPSHV